MQFSGKQSKGHIIYGDHPCYVKMYKRPATLRLGRQGSEMRESLEK